MLRNTLTIRAGGCVIRGTPTPLEPVGIFVGKDGFTGWTGIATRRREQVARAVEHGEHDLRVYLGARVVTIDGWIIAHTEQELRQYSHQLAGLGGDGQPVTVTVDHLGQTLHASGRVLIAQADDKGVRWRKYLRASFQLQIVFANPRKYGGNERFPSTGYATINDVYGRGNFPSHPVIEFGAGPSSWTCSAPGGRTLQVSGAPSGGLQRFDMRTGRLTRDGVDITTAVVAGSVWAIPVGETWRHTLNVPGRILAPETYI